MSDDDKRNPNNPDNPGDDNDAFWAFESDPDLAREMESLNQELANLEQNASTDDAGESATGESEDGNAPEDVSDEFSQIMNANAEIGFDDELEGILGNKAKRAILVTRLTSADLLAAFCSLADITAQCIDSREGAVAVLRNLNGDGPEAAAKDLTEVVAGLSVLLLVDRADKMTAVPYSNGTAEDAELPPPFVLETLAHFVEDLMLGLTTVDALAQQGVRIVDSADLDHDHALKIIAEHTNFGRDGSSID